VEFEAMITNGVVRQAALVSTLAGSTGSLLLSTSSSSSLLLTGSIGGSGGDDSLRRAASRYDERISVAQLFVDESNRKISVLVHLNVCLPTLAILV
jgi:hypothetical protein